MVLLVTGLVGAALADFELVVIHTNDMHARLDEIAAGGGSCGKSSKCYGGFARIKAAADQVRATRKNVIFLNAGDSFQGSPYYSVYKWEVIAQFVDMLGIDVMSLGNHEFDDGVSGLAPYLRTIKTPTVVCNINYDKEPALLGTNFHRWYSLKVDGTHIAVVGYLTPDTMFLSKTDKVFIMDEVESIRKAASEARAAGAKIVIAVGHSGFDMDRKIAQEVENIDVVVGGHTNTFLYTGDAPDIEVPASVYPHMETQASGKKVPVVQAFAWTKYLGVLNLKFNDKYQLVSASGNPILMDSTKPKDPKVSAKLDYWKNLLNSRTAMHVGTTTVDLDGNCRNKECNLGNMVADALYEYGQVAAAGNKWPKIPLVLYNGGGVRSSILLNSTGGSLTMGDILTSFPFENQLRVVSLTGKALKQAIEVGVAEYDPAGIILKGSFPMMSGIRVVYDIRKPPGSRIMSLKVICSECPNKEYRDINMDETYLVILPSFLADGGDGFTVLKEKAEHVAFIDDSDTQVISDYVKRHGTVSPVLDGRIKFVSSRKYLPIRPGRRG
uniref:5'-nucleotidase n=1 Tax=Lethocerus distinctifemur TaxID=280095 RepID=A0A2K8JLG0_9HEMI|nr:venom 5' nucleotidase 2 [Lethocerus distinctifemur]